MSAGSKQPGLGMNGEMLSSMPNPRIAAQKDGTLKIRIGTIEGVCPSHLFAVRKIHQLQRAWLIAQGETPL